MYRIVIAREDDIYLATTVGKKAALDCGLDKIQQTKLAVSILELTRNIIFYAGKGELFIKPIPSFGVEIIAIDKGPGISNLDEIISNKVHSKKGLGLGLAGVKRLMDSFEITSTSHTGTKIRAVKLLHERRTH